MTVFAVSSDYSSRGFVLIKMPKQEQVLAAQGAAGFMYFQKQSLLKGLKKNLFSALSTLYIP